MLQEWKCFQISLNILWKFEKNNIYLGNVHEINVQ
jgi:hypothetical protein